MEFIDCREIENMPNDANKFSGRFILTFKNLWTPNELANLRYVAQGFKESYKTYMVHDTATMPAASFRQKISAVAVNALRVFSHDVTQAYLQSKEKVTRKIYIRPKREDFGIFGLDEEELLQLRRSLNGIFCGRRLEARD